MFTPTVQLVILYLVAVVSLYNVGGMIHGHVTLNRDSVQKVGPAVQSTGKLIGIWLLASIGAIILSVLLWLLNGLAEHWVWQVARGAVILQVLGTLIWLLRARRAYAH